MFRENVSEVKYLNALHTLLTPDNIFTTVSKVETLHLNQDVGDSEVTSWREQSENARDYISFIRVFGLNRPNEAASTSLR
jgi:hypothetical protein